MSGADNHMEQCFEHWNEPYLIEYKKKYTSKYAPGEDEPAFLEFVNAMRGMFVSLEVKALKKKYEAKKKENSEKEEKEAVPEIRVPDNNMKIDSHQVAEVTSTKMLPISMPTPLTSAVAGAAAEKKKDDNDDEKEKKQKNPPKRAKKEKVEPLPLTRDVSGWHKASLVGANQVDITIEKITEYAKDKQRALYMIACVLATKLQSSAPVYEQLCKEAFVYGAFFDKKPAEAVKLDLSAGKERTKVFNDKLDEFKKSLRELTPEVYGPAKEPKLLLFDAALQLRRFFFRTVPFSSVAPYAFGDSVHYQVYVLAFQPPDSTGVSVMSMPKYNFSKLYPIEERRAFFNLLFSTEVDENGIALMDVGAIGERIVEDVKLETDELYKAYMEGDGNGVFAWFKKNFPNACDDSVPNHLTAADCALVADVKNLEKYKSPPATKSASTKKPAKSKAKATTEEAKEGDEKIDAKNTIKQFAVNVNDVKPKGSKIAQTAGFFTLQKTNEEYASMIAYVENHLKSTGFDEELARKLPLTSKEDILAKVMPHTESKAANSMAKKSQKKKGKSDAANAEAAAGADEDGGAAAADADVPESARDQYQAYSAQIPKASRTMFMANDLTNKLNNLTNDNTKPTTKAASDVKVQTSYARALHMERYGTEGVIPDGATLAAVLDGVLAGDPASIVRLIMAKQNLFRYMFRIANDAQRRNEFKVKEDQLGELFNDDKFCMFIAQCVTLDSALDFCLCSYNTDEAAKNFAAAKRIVEKVDVSKGWF